MLIRISPAASKAFLVERSAVDPEDGMAWFYLGVRAHLEGNAGLAEQRLERAARLGYPPPTDPGPDPGS